MLAFPTLIPVELSASASNETLYFFISISLKVPEFGLVKSKFNPTEFCTFEASPLLSPMPASCAVRFEPPILILNLELKKLLDVVSGSVKKLSPTDSSQYISIVLFNLISDHDI